MGHFDEADSQEEKGKLLNMLFTFMHLQHKPL